MSDIGDLAMQIYTYGSELAADSGMVLVIVVAPDGAYQMRCSALNVNQAVGVLTRSAIALSRNDQLPKEVGKP